MICKNVQKLFDDYIDGTGSEIDARQIDIHCETCEACSSELGSLRVLHDALATLPVPPPSEGFEHRVISAAIADARVGNVADSGVERFRYANNRGLYNFAAAAMISAVVLFLGPFYGGPSTEKTPYLVVVGGEVRTIKVAIDSEQALDTVDMRVELSDNLELSGFGNKKQIQWTTNLRQGVNVISLPIVGIAQGEGDITTRIRLNGKEKIMRIKTQY
ncbi:MAG TPA: hypothetical protein ENJ87_08880, partial [Gammaproteobacteria bacterium]|nr:hypothetical protein [Gammaproteobacteria bacterium]